MGTIIPQAVIDRMVKLLETIFQEPTNEIPLLKGHLLIEEMLDKMNSNNGRGEWLTAEGHGVQDREFGLQFRAEMFSSTAPIRMVEA